MAAVTGRWSQVTYATFDKGRHGEPAGWRVGECLNESPEDRRAVEGFASTFIHDAPPPGTAVEDPLTDLSYRFSYLIDGRGCGFYLQSVPGGLDSASRPGNVFTHCFIDHEIATPTAVGYPIDAADSRSFTRPYGTIAVNDVQLQPCDGGPVEGTVIDPVEAWSVARSAPHVLPLIQKHLVAGNNAFVVVDSIEQALQWIKALSLTLSVKEARRWLAFSTWNGGSGLRHARSSYKRPAVHCVDRSMIRPSTNTQFFVDPGKPSTRSTGPTSRWAEATMRMLDEVSDPQDLWWVSDDEAMGSSMGDVLADALLSGATAPVRRPAAADPVSGVQQARGAEVPPAPIAQVPPAPSAAPSTTAAMTIAEAETIFGDTLRSVDGPPAPTARPGDGPPPAIPRSAAPVTSPVPTTTTAPSSVSGDPWATATTPAVAADGAWVTADEFLAFFGITVVPSLAECPAANNPVVSSSIAASIGNAASRAELMRRRWFDYPRIGEHECGPGLREAIEVILTTPLDDKNYGSWVGDWWVALADAALNQHIIDDTSIDDIVAAHTEAEYEHYFLTEWFESPQRVPALKPRIKELMRRMWMAYYAVQSPDKTHWLPSRQWFVPQGRTICRYKTDLIDLSCAGNAVAGAEILAQRLFDGRFNELTASDVVWLCHTNAAFLRKVRKSEKFTFGEMSPVDEFTRMLLLVNNHHDLIVNAAAALPQTITDTLLQDSFLSSVRGGNVAWRLIDVLTTHPERLLVEHKNLPEAFRDDPAYLAGLLRVLLTVVGFAGCSQTNLLALDIQNRVSSWVLQGLLVWASNEKQWPHITATIDLFDPTSDDTSPHYQRVVCDQLRCATANPAAYREGYERTITDVAVKLQQVVAPDNPMVVGIQRLAERYGEFLGNIPPTGLEYYR